MKACPDCRENGQPVKRITLESVLRPERLSDIGAHSYNVCTTPHCNTVYFGPTPGRVFCKSDLTIRFGLKETNAPRPVCYCFDHTVEGIQDEIRRTGNSTIIESIKTDMKSVGCRCEHTNPLGSCCLRSVQAAVVDAFRVVGKDEKSATTECGDHGGCCGNGERGTDQKRTPSGCCATDSELVPNDLAANNCCQTRSNVTERDPRRNRAGAMAVGGSVVAAILSSACCWLPLVLITVGVSATGVAGFFETYRPYFIASAIALLGFGFYFVYFRNDHCEAGSACEAPNLKLKTFNQVTLWVATVLVGALVMFPDYVGIVFGSPGQTSATVDGIGLARDEYHIEGMTCKGCADILRTTLTQLPGVKFTEVDFAAKSAVVQYEPNDPLSPESVIQAVQAAGYQATIVTKRVASP
ncbi:MAG: cation transporter [Phycisphaerales bacterium]|nr:cation transporter [Phycisphaerales bacterium]